MIDEFEEIRVAVRRPYNAVTRSLWPQFSYPKPDKPEPNR